MNEDSNYALTLAEVKILVFVPRYLERRSKKSQNMMFFVRTKTKQNFQITPVFLNVFAKMQPKYHSLSFGLKV